MKDWFIFRLKNNFDYDITCKGWFVTLIHPIILLIAGIVFTIALPITLSWVLYEQFAKHEVKEMEVKDGKN